MRGSGWQAPCRTRADGGGRCDPVRLLLITSGTLARVAALLHRPDRGTVSLDARAVTGYRHRAPRDLRTSVGVVFQQPRLAVDPRLRLRDLVAEPLRATGRRTEADASVAELTERVGLGRDLLTRRAHGVSDGRLQRACLTAPWCCARAGWSATR